jgi:preprotein translocase subunit SecA
MKKDKDYVVQDGEILIVDQNTGRIMDGRRFSEGLHQAIEAKESVEVKDETVTLATVTIQNYFRMYQKIGGMTGTAKTEEEELQKIYGLDVIVIPTHREIARIDDPDEIYLSKEEKGLAIVKEVLERHTAGQPVLVGTASIEDNEWLSDLFNKNNIPHQVLNAKNHGREADIISNAGEKGAVTIATNMAGRGTDIKLADGVKELGGLAVIGTEKHESRRIDNQLKGRSGRQGDPGYSKFILSLEDELIERFNGKKIKDLAEKLGFPKNEPISHRMVVKAITGAQKRMEGSNFDIRKNLLEYDEVMDIQRKFIYKERKEIMDIKDTRTFSQSILKEFVKAQIQQRYDEAEPEKTMEWVVNELTGAIQPGEFNIDYIDDVIEGVQKKVLENYDLKRKNVGDEILNEVEKTVFLEFIDQFWVKHIDHLVNLKEGIHLRAYAQSNPLVEYQKEAAGMFQGMLDELQYYYSMNVIHFQISVVPE